MNFNKAIILGNLTRDPERRSLPSGDSVVSFSVASNRYYTSQGERKEDTEFHNIVIFGKMAETAAQYLKKGSLVLIEGRLKTRTWQSQDGQKHYKTEIVAESMQLGPRGLSKQSEGPYQSNSNPRPTPQVKPPISEAEIPVIQEDEPISQDPDDQGQIPKEDEAQEEIDVKNIPF